MIVLSLFDGMSCGQIALRGMGIPVTRYYASEVDKFAVHNTLHNFLDTIMLGDVRNVSGKQLGKVDLLMGGSPCQSFSFMGNRVGMKTEDREEVTTIARYMELKQGGFQFLGQSYLFWEYVRILHELREENPDILFLLENVEMGKKWESVIDNALGIRGAHINSSLVSAQTRRRIYWTNINARQTTLFTPYGSGIPQPADRGITVADILEDNVQDKYYLHDATVKRMITAYERENGGGTFSEDISGHHIVFPIAGDRARFFIHKGSKVPCIGAHYANGYGLRKERGYVLDRRAVPVRVRRLTPTECARLQTVPDWYRLDVSETQQYKMLGNGWTIEVIKHILSFLPGRFNNTTTEDNENKHQGYATPINR